MRLLEPTAQIWMKIDPHYQRQKCRPMNLVSENIRFMRIFAGVPLGACVKRHWGLSTTAIFGDLGGYVFENFRDQIRQAIICHNVLPLVDRQMIAKWMTLNDFMTKCVFSQHVLNQSVWMSEIVQPLRFCGVLCIARSVSQPIGRHAQLTRCFSAVAELLVLFRRHCIVL